MAPSGSRPYFAQRRGQQLPQLDYVALRRLLLNALDDYEEGGWFQFKLGKDCVDAHRDLGACYLEALGQDLYPFQKVNEHEDDGSLFSLIEFLYDNAAKPVSSHNHGYAGCGIHVDDADVEAGRTEFRARINGLLSRYETPLVLRQDGEIWELPPTGMEQLVPVQTGQPSIDDRVASARRAFHIRGATRANKRHAINDLAAVLEHHRPLIKAQLHKNDESALFNIANNYGLRHHNENQKTDYDDEFADWIFYTYLNAIGLLARLVNRSKPKATNAPPWAVADSDLPF